MAHPPNRIDLIFKGRLEEAYAAGAIKPGHLVKLDSNGELVVHATAGGVGESAFAFEDVLQGKGIDDAYADNDLVRYGLGVPGDVYLIWLKAGENVVKGDHLISAGDGTLKKTTGSPTKVFAVCMEALDLSGGGAVNTLMRARLV